MAEVIFIALIFAAPLFLVSGLIFFRPFLNQSWKSYITWEAVPVLQLLFLFVLIASINWPYESKLLRLRTSADPADAYLGPILLVCAFGSSLINGLLLFLMRQLLRRIYGSKGTWYSWSAAVILGLGICLITVESAAIVLLGPAAMTMRDQMKSVPPS
jgi:hypothetical protein